MEKSYLLSLLVGLALQFSLSAQCYQSQPLEGRLAASELLVAGRVITSEPFYNERGQIYTMHSVEVAQSSASAHAEGDVVQFFTMGGTIGEERLVVSPSLQVEDGARGIFLLRNYRGNRVDVSAGNVYQPVSVQQSVLPFDPMTGTFRDGNNVIGTIEDVSTLAATYLGQPLNNLDHHDWNARPVGRSLMPVIDDFFPYTVNAGTDDLLSIIGTGFGNMPGDVLLDSPVDGPGGAYAVISGDDIFSWSDTQIDLRVVSTAGTGPVIVSPPNGIQAQSNNDLQVDFAITNLNVNVGGNEMRNTIPYLIDDSGDGNGGYTFMVSNSNANGGVSLADHAPALAAVNRAVSTWQQEGDFSIFISGTTSIQVPATDGVNVISFGSNSYDFDQELGNGVLGIAFSYYSICGSSQLEVKEADVFFRRDGDPNGTGGSVNYDFGGGQGSTDFEGTALHEFGHVHQLEHVMDPNELMAYASANGTTLHSLTSAALAGSSYVRTLSAYYNPPPIDCGDDFLLERMYIPFSQLNPNPLPVTWLSFTAQNQEKSVQLNWATAAEEANDYFFVERSADGVNFTNIARVAAANRAAGAAYTYQDATPLSGVSYYRITQTDLAGTQSRTQIREVTRTQTGELVVFPNPVHDVLQVAAGNAAGGTYKLTDASGRELRTVTLAEGETTLRLNVANLPAGTYLLRADDGRVVRFVR